MRTTIYKYKNFWFLGRQWEPNSVIRLFGVTRSINEDAVKEYFSWSEEAKTSDGILSVAPEFVEIKDIDI
jgi:hypothetical protein